MRLHTVATILAMVCITMQSIAQNSLVPLPQSTMPKKGLVKPSEITSISIEGAEMPVLYGKLDNLPRKRQNNGVNVSITVDSVFPRLGREGYILSIAPNAISVKANTSAGAFYGAVTLSQIIQEAEDKSMKISSMQIEDYPALPIRSVHFDTKHHLDRAEYYYSLIDKLAYWKVNSIIWELEDKFRYESHPECSAPNALSKQEMRAIADYAHERNIEITPLVQGLGHAGYILKKHWELRENPESDWELCPSNPSTYDILFDLYSEAIEAFPYSEFIHIGGDEISEIGIDQRCKDTGATPFQLQMLWLEKVTEFVKSKGKTPIFWDDMPLKYANLWWVIHGGLSDSEVDANWNTDRLDEAIGMFPKDCVYMRWHYDDPTIYPHLKVLDWYKNKGLRVMAATAAADGGSPYMPRHGSKAGEISSFCQLAVDNNLNEGILATCWDDGSPHWETVLRGFAALGEYAWNPKGRSNDEFKEAASKNIWGLYNGETSFIEELEKAADYFDGALVQEGRRNPAWQVRDYKLIDLPFPTNDASWRERYRSLLDSARIQVARCEGIEQSIRHASDMSRRNRYPFAIYQANNNLFKFPALLLLALEEYDLSGNTKTLEKVCNDFDLTKQELVKTYSKTRFMEQPAGYIADQNHHKHLAALRPDANWLFLYEDAAINQIRQEILK